MKKIFIIILLLFTTTLVRSQIIVNALKGRTQTQIQDSINDVNFYAIHHKTDSILMNLQIRKLKMDSVIALMKSNLDDITFVRMETDMSTYISDYLSGSDKILHWLAGDNTYYGDFTSTGLTSKNYYTNNLQGRTNFQNSRNQQSNDIQSNILNILTIH
jgi:hypothetical protein